eukprot:GHVQ01013178.1.p1 GENE.GHVQ01013178.1~~GHVQ01013178.1.p1  ORF type:complete len:286 (+),score=35.66 GHVQ01013178.1:230-1087(+)
MYPCQDNPTYTGTMDEDTTDAMLALRFHDQDGCYETECRFCDRVVVLPLPDITTVDNRRTYPRASVCCNRAECRMKAVACCNRMLPCGHSCGGVFGEWKEDGSDPSAGMQANLGYCVCTHTQCCSMQCSICLEDLRTDPCVKLSCGHILHEGCICGQIEMSSLHNDVPLDFSSLKCPQCRKFTIDHPMVKQRIDHYMEIHKITLNLAALYAKKEGLKDDHGEFLTGEAALKALTFFMCYRCTTPFYGGKKSCADDVTTEKDGDGQKRICPGCFCAEHRTVCSKHG